MMRRLLLIAAALLCGATPGLANFAFSPAGGTTMFSIDAANQGSALCAAGATECAASVPINTAGVPLFTATLPAQVSIANTGANATAVKVDGSAVTQPVSGTVAAIQGTAANLNATVVGTGTFVTQAAQSGAWNITNVSGTVSLPTGAATAVKQPALGTAGTASSDVITIQGIASMTKLLVTPDSVALPANQSVNVSQFNGVTPLMGNGVSGTGAQRVTIASDNTAFSVNANAGTNLNTSALATSANLTAGSMKTQVVDGIGNVIGSTSNNLNVQCANCSGSGVSTGDEASFTAGSSLFAGTGGFFQTTATNNALTNLQQGMFQVTANRALFSNLRNAAGAEVGTAGAPLQVSLANTAANGTAVLVNQPTAANLNATVVGTGTFATQSTLNAETTKVIGTVRNVGNAGGVLDAAVAGTYPANALAVGVLNGANIGRLVGDETNGLWVNIKAGAGSGGTAIADKGAWTVSSTNLTPIGGEFTTGGATACATGQVCTAAMTASRGIFNDVNTWAETALGAPSAYGTSPGAVNVIGVNAFVTNALTSVNDNADAVAVATPFGSPIVNHNYGFNGTSWDRLQVDANKSLKVVSQPVGDPCMFQAKLSKNINTATGTTLLVAASGSTKVYVCSFAVVTPSAVSVSLSEGTGATCNTANQAGVMGVAVNGTAGNGMPFAANGGMTYGNGGSTVAYTATAANALCLFQSGTAQLAGNLMYVQQ